MFFIGERIVVCFNLADIFRLNFQTSASPIIEGMQSFQNYLVILMFSIIFFFILIRAFILFRFYPEYSALRELFRMSRDPEQSRQFIFIILVHLVVWPFFLISLYLMENTYHHTNYKRTEFEWNLKFGSELSTGSALSLEGTSGGLEQLEHFFSEDKIYLDSFLRETAIRQNLKPLSQEEILIFYEKVDSLRPTFSSIIDQLKTSQDDYVQILMNSGEDVSKTSSSSSQTKVSVEAKTPWSKGSWSKQWSSTQSSSVDAGPCAKIEMFNSIARSSEPGSDAHKEATLGMYNCSKYTNAYNKTHKNFVLTPSEEGAFHEKYDRTYNTPKCSSGQEITNLKKDDTK